MVATLADRYAFVKQPDKHGPTIRREIFNHLKPLDDLLRTEFPPCHCAPFRKRRIRAVSERPRLAVMSTSCALTSIRNLAGALSFRNKANWI
jgi:hypothetical protein